MGHIVGRRTCSQFAYNYLAHFRRKLIGDADCLDRFEKRRK